MTLEELRKQLRKGVNRNKEVETAKHDLCDACSLGAERPDLIAWTEVRYLAMDTNEATLNPML